LSGEAHKPVLHEIAARARTQRAGLRLLFTGANVSAKLNAAELLAGLLQLSLYRVDLTAVVSKHIKETEKNLDRLFTVAETQEAILFLDEADALFGKRSDVKDAHDRYRNIEVNYLLQKMETFNGIAILASGPHAVIKEAVRLHFPFVLDFC
jgi:SpoVK/Ycf46/Vps4 family AAA+-type ATPase